MTINNFTFFSPNGTEFPVSANADGKLYMMLTGMDLNTFRRRDWTEPVDTALNRQYTNTSLVVGGRYFELESETVELSASTDNYVHANIDLTNTTSPVSISVENADNSNAVDVNNDSGVLKQCFDIVTTDGSNVIAANIPPQNITISGEARFGKTTVSSIASTNDTNTATINGAGAPSGKLRYLRKNGIVYLTGGGNWGALTAGQTKTVGTLPAGFRPPATWETAGSPMGGTDSYSWKVETNGEVKVTIGKTGNNRYSGFSMVFPAAN